MLTLESLKRILHYDPETGIFTRKTKTPRTPVGAIAGYVNQLGYNCIQADGRPYRSHRLAWFYMTGVMPTSYIDHINGNKSDNRFSNLRLADNATNQANRGAPKNNTSGFKGVTWQPLRKKWLALITINGRAVNLGRYDTAELASLAYQTAAKNAWGEYAHGATLRREDVPQQIRSGAVLHRELTQDVLKDLFDYDPDAGRFTRRKVIQGRSKVGEIAGYTEYTGYRKIKVHGKNYREHHLAWLWVYGVLPRDEIDHINGDPGDNRIANLRECDRVRNLWNRRVQTRAMTQAKGVTFDDRCVRKWIARIKVGDRERVIGYFLTKEDAAAAYIAAAKAAFGEFAKVPQQE